MSLDSFSAVLKPLDASEIPGFFSRYPVGISVEADRITKALRQIGIEATMPDTRERHRAKVRQASPYGDPFSICHCSAFPDRLELVGYIIEILWIHDDIIEELDHSIAMKEHELLAQMLTVDIDPSTFAAVNRRQSALARILRLAIDMDPAQGPALVKTLQTYLEAYDSTSVNFDKFEEYSAFRILNSGYAMSSFLMRWGMGFDLSEEYAQVKEYDMAIASAAGLTNDYFSWNVEKNQPTDRVRNGVDVLRRELKLSDSAAMTMLAGVIVDEERRAVKLKQALFKQEPSERVLQYCTAIELFAGGSCYWQATAPRYQVQEA
ncbi:isoprenoid synthase domain-containing protein [Emericellopsis atlantica]|uniref:Isoprenoid synthase domain-containing protein n=1 Tax=Emericellopsis atlantica TaxID=2614577 RepID=A0A9P7ZIH6_9HYPO|nr:isoprenoid synthase domain-containing protein [Emericellopsis atlantica]KAG9252302.1 isoprenoid synthase domain-containing protein [Emericellopsis atlantica]